MPKCAYCNSTIVFGGVQDGDLRFCNNNCHQSGALLLVARLVPDDTVRQRLNAVHQGSCPKCQRSGPVDVHTSYSVWSMLVMTSWKSQPQVSCAPCGKKAKITSTLSSLFLGWWGIPWGLLLTPIQITRNLVGLATTQSSSVPSEQLEKIVRLTLAAELPPPPTASPVMRR